jgi:hypothetical protein
MGEAFKVEVCVAFDLLWSTDRYSGVNAKVKKARKPF